MIDLRSAFLGICLSCVSITSAAVVAPNAVLDVASPVESEVESYLADSTAKLEDVLAAMRDYAKDLKHREKALALMHAVKSFDASTSAGYERARTAVAGSSVLRQALDAFRSNQASLARRLLNAEIGTWDPILAEYRRLEEAVREAARSPVTT